VFATSGTDRSICLYDLRMGSPMRKLIMQNKTNAIAWNPMEAFNFTVANEDCNLYSYDMRKLQIATCVHQDFVSVCTRLRHFVRTHLCFVITDKVNINQKTCLRSDTFILWNSS
jgi:WD40 repeat protein